MTREFPQVTMPEASQHIHRPDIEDENSNKTCRILSNRIIKECKRLYNNLDEFDVASLSLTLSTTTSEGMIKILKNLRSIDAVNNDAISFTFFVNEILMKC